MKRGSSSEGEPIGNQIPPEIRDKLLHVSKQDDIETLAKSLEENPEGYLFSDHPYGVVIKEVLAGGPVGNWAERAARKILKSTEDTES